MQHKPTATEAAFQAAFMREATIAYPKVDALERELGFEAPMAALYMAARVLACPVKVNPPNWQHGRILYACARKYLEASPKGERFRLLDIGTAKGFSALCLAWALRDSGRQGEIVSVDVLDPGERVRRNTVAEVERPRTLSEILAPWAVDLDSAVFLKSTGVAWLEAHPERIHVAFVDGKHKAAEVLQEGRLLAKRQQRGDLAIFDDLQIPDVNQAVQALEGEYRFRWFDLMPSRMYGIGERR